MSLLQRLMLVFTVISMLLLIAISWKQVATARSYLQDQLQTTAQDVATMLAISLSQSEEQRQNAESLFSAIFDNGHYQQITYTVQGKVLHERYAEPSNTIPGWVISVFNLTSVKANARVLAGWQMAGIVSVQVQPEYIYASLYSNLKYNLIIFLLSLILIGILLWRMLRWILSPIDIVERQAKAIEDHHYLVQDLPSTPELKRVVRSTNQLIQKIEQQANSQQETLGLYQALLYQDELTGAFNRAYFLRQLENKLVDTAIFSGHAILFSIQNLDVLREQSYEYADQVIQLTADSLGNDVCRIANHELGYILPANAFVANQQVQAAMDTIKQKITELRQTHARTDIAPVIVASLTELHSGQPVYDILSRLDLGNTQAHSQGSYTIQYVSQSNLQLPQGRKAWRDWFSQAFKSQQFYLVTQPVFNDQGECIQQEAFIRIDDAQGKTIPAGIFVPMAMALNYGLHIDQVVFQQMVALKSTQQPLAVNLTSAFFTQPNAYAEFQQMLQKYANTPGKIHVEISQALINQYYDRCRIITDEVARYQQVFGVDQYDLTTTTKDFSALKVGYIKVNARALSDLGISRTSLAYSTMQTMVQTYGVTVYAVGIDNETLYEDLKKLKIIEGYQGYLLGEPHRLSP